MKVLVFSDLHNEFDVFIPPYTEKGEIDAVILSGDTDLGTRGAVWALKSFKDLPILYVVGNHEYYGWLISEINLGLEAVERNNDNFHFLYNKELVLNGVRFLGCTLWTDFALYGPAFCPEAKRYAQKNMADFEVIIAGSVNRTRRLRPADTVEMHRESIRFLQERLSTAFSGPTVVITHHAPLRRSISDYHWNSLLSAAFASNLDDLILKYEPRLWIHGHTHHNVDYVFGSTRVISNQRGYVPHERTDRFEEYFVVDV